MIGQGTIAKIGANVIADVTEVGGIEVSRETTDRTTYASAGWKEIGAGMKDGGEVTIKGLYSGADTNGQNALYASLDSDALVAFSIILPPAMGVDFTFNALVTKFSIDPPGEEEITWEATLKISGKPTLGLTASVGLTALALTGTGGTISPAFDDEIYYYAFGGVTAASVTVTATAATQTMKLFVNGVYVQDLTTASPSGAIVMAIGTKKITIIANEAAKTQKIYEVVVEKIS